MEELKSKIILVTGAGQGLGEAISTSLSLTDSIIIPVDIKKENVYKVSENIVKTGGKSTAFEMDVTDPESVKKVIEEIIDKYGRLDVVINNAGIDATKPISELSIQEWERVIKVNLTGPFIVSKTAFSIMREQKKGHIVNISSTAAKRAWSNASCYHASKWGLLGFSHALYVEGRPFNIKSTVVIAGGMRTPFLLDRFPDIDQTKLQDPKNVAETIKFILSQPDETIIPEVMVIPMQETSWP